TPGHGRWVLDGPPSGDGNRIPAFRDGDRVCDRRRATAGGDRLPGGRPGSVGAGIAGVPEHTWPGRPERLPQLVGVRPGRLLAAPRGTGQRLPRPRTAP